MSRLQVAVLGEGQHPSERVISIRTAAGETETVYVDKESLENSTIDVGQPVGRNNDRLLVELPRETTSGRWRIWVNEKDVLQGIPA